MRCEQSEAWMMQALDGMLPSTDRQRLMAHLDVCPACRDDWEALNAVERMFANPTLLGPAPGFIERVDARIARAEAQRRTLLGGLVLLGAAAALCLLAVPALLGGRSPLAAYGDFLTTSYNLIVGAALLGYKLATALWFVLNTLSRSMHIPLATLFTYVAGAILAVAAWRRAVASPRIPVHNQRSQS
jgi:predicted anti-sigma-YlaC factor YlaD